MAKKKIENTEFNDDKLYSGFKFLTEGALSLNKFESFDQMSEFYNSLSVDQKNSFPLYYECFVEEDFKVNLRSLQRTGGSIFKKSEYEKAKKFTKTEQNFLDKLRESTEYDASIKDSFIRIFTMIRLKLNNLIRLNSSEIALVQEWKMPNVDLSYMDKPKEVVTQTPLDEFVKAFKLSFGEIPELPIGIPREEYFAQLTSTEEDTSDQSRESNISKLVSDAVSDATLEFDEEKEHRKILKEIERYRLELEEIYETYEAKKDEFFRLAVQVEELDEATQNLRKLNSDVFDVETQLTEKTEILSKLNADVASAESELAEIHKKMLGINSKILSAEKYLEIILEKIERNKAMQTEYTASKMAHGRRILEADKEAGEGIKEDARKYAATLILEAKKRAEQIDSEAKLTAVEIIDEAEKRDKVSLWMTDIEVNKRLSGANAKAYNIVHEAELKAVEMLKEAELKAVEILKEAKLKAVEILKEAKKNGATAGKLEAGREIDKGRKEIQKLRDELKIEREALDIRVKSIVEFTEKLKEREKKLTEAIENFENEKRKFYAKCEEDNQDYERKMDEFYMMNSDAARNLDDLIKEREEISMLKKQIELEFLSLENQNRKLQLREAEFASIYGGAEVTEDEVIVDNEIPLNVIPEDIFETFYDNHPDTRSHQSSKSPISGVRYKSDSNTDLPTYTGSSGARYDDSDLRKTLSTADDSIQKLIDTANYFRKTGEAGKRRFKSTDREITQTYETLPESQDPYYNTSAKSDDTPSKELPFIDINELEKI